MSGQRPALPATAFNLLRPFQYLDFGPKPLIIVQVAGKSFAGARCVAKSAGIGNPGYRSKRYPPGPGVRATGYWRNMVAPLRKRMADTAVVPTEERGLNPALPVKFLGVLVPWW
jgi:hypothetical protein